MKPLGTQDLFSFCSSSLEGVALVLRPLFFIFKIYFLLFWLHWVFVALHGLSLVLASMGLSLQWPLLQRMGLRAHRLSCSAACGIFLDQGLKSCPLHFKTGS